MQFVPPATVKSAEPAVSAKAPPLSPVRVTPVISPTPNSPALLVIVPEVVRLPDSSNLNYTLFPIIFAVPMRKSTLSISALPSTVD